jgi:Ser/Thr protein kinase RdoA (MazF antagonist)
MTTDPSLPAAVLSAYSLQDAAIETGPGGNINRSFMVTAATGEEYVLQYVNPVFAREVHEDIEAVTAHLESRGMITPRLVRNREGALFTEADGEIWRLLTRIPGHTPERLTDPATAAGAGGLLARFHAALADLEHDFRQQRGGIHDTARHLENLRAALLRHSDHPRYARVEPLGKAILALAETLPPLTGTPDRTVHGDPKISNILFDEGGAAVCLIDLDTLGRMPLSLELGDALRSWCNPRGEDTDRTTFSLELFRGAVQGYAGAAPEFLLPEEWRAFVPAIYIELAARFCADALNETYFNWDERAFKSRSEHNRVRAAGQLQAARALGACYVEAEELVEAAFERD